ncbi:putative ribonuclease H-like domain-containing protein [Tanacetum coccineum]
MFLLISQRLSATTVTKKGILLENVDLEGVKEEDLMVKMAGAMHKQLNLHLRHWVCHKLDDLCNKSETDSGERLTVLTVWSRNPLTPRADISFAGLDEYAFRNKIIESNTTETNKTVGNTNEATIVKPKSVNDTVVSKSNINKDEVIIEDWTLDDGDDVCAVKTISFVKPNVTQAIRSQADKSGQSRDLVTDMPSGGSGYLAYDLEHSYLSDYCRGFSMEICGFWNFKLLDESQVVLRAPRKDDVYSLDLKNIVPSRGKSPSISFMRPFGCPLTILNTLDSLGKFDGKSDEGYLLGYSTSSKAFRVYNKRTKMVEENLHINFLEDQPNVAGTGPNWMFDLDFLTNSMDYIPVSVENQVIIDAVKDVVQDAQEQPSENASPDKGIHDSEDVFDKEGQHQMPEDEHLPLKKKRGIASQKKAAQATSTNQLSTDRPFVSTDRSFVSTDRSNTPNVSVASTSTGANADESLFVYLGGKIPIDASTLPNADLPIDPNMPDLEDACDTLPNDGIFNGAYDDDEDVGEVVDFNNIDNTIIVSPIPTLRIHKDHPKGQILGDPTSAIQTRGKIQKASSAQQALVSYIHKQNRTNHKDHQNCLFACFLSQEEPKTILQALKDERWVEAMQEELLQFKLQQVWILVDLPFGKKAIGTKWVFRNKRDERSIVVKNKARLVAQDGLNDSQHVVLEPKSAFLYGTIEEEVYVHQPPGFVDPAHPNKVYKVVKALYGLHQAPRAWYETLSSFLLENGFRRGYRRDEATSLMEWNSSLVKTRAKALTGKNQQLGSVPFSWDCYEKRLIDVLKIHTDSNVTDLLTKGFDVTRISMELRMNRNSPGKYNSSMVYKHNMVTFLKKPNESVGFTEVVDFLKGTSLRTLANGTQQLVASIDSKEYNITEASVRSKLQLADATGIHNLSDAEIYAGLATLGPKSGGWDQFGSTIATALICLSSNRVYNFSKMIFDGMVHNLESNSKFLMYPRFLQIILDITTENKGRYLAPTLTKKLFANMKRGYAGDIVPLLPAMLAGAAVDQGEGSAQPAEPHHTPVDPISSTSQPPIPSPPHQSPPHSPPHSPPYSPPGSYEAPLPEGNTSRSAKDSVQLRELMVLVPTLVTRINSLEQELKDTKQTLGNAVLKLVKKVKSLETALKRKSKKVLISESEGEESEDQGRNQDINDDPLASLVRESMKEKSTDFVTPTKASGEAQEEEISPTILEAAKTLSKVASQGVSKEKSTDKGKRYRRRARSMAKKIDTGLDAEEEINTGREKINTGIEEVSTGSTKIDSGTASKRSQREGKAPMVEEDIQATHKTKEQMRQEQAGLEEAIKLQAQLDEEVAKQIHLDKMIAKRMAEEEALSEQQKKRKAQVQFEAQFYTEEDWDTIRAKLEANAELSKDVLGQDLPEQDFAKRMVDMLSQLKKLKFEEIKEEFDKLVQQIDTFVPINLEATKTKLKRYGEELQTKTSKKQKFDDKDIPAIGEKVAEVKEEEPVKRTGKRKKQKARKGVNVDKSAQEDSETDKDESVEAMNPTPLTTKSNTMIKDFTREDLIELYRLVMQKYGTNRPEDAYDRVLWSDLRTMFDPPLIEDAIWSLPLQQKMISWRYYDKCEVHCLTLEACTIYMLADRKYPLSKDACQVMLKMKLLDGKMNEVCYKLLKMIEKQAGIRNCEEKTKTKRQSVLNGMGCGDVIEEMLEIKVYEMRGEDEILTSKAWRHAFDISEPIYTELCHEFYATYEFDEEVTDEELMSNKLIKFRLGGCAHSLTILEFAHHLGLISSKYGLILSRSLARTIEDHVLRVLQKIITYGLCQRTTGYDKVQRNELWLMSMIGAKNREGYANVAWLIAKWIKRKGFETQKESMICCRQFMTSNAPGVHRAIVPRPLRHTITDLYDRIGYGDSLGCTREDVT